jgi:hypothetical protein
MDESEPGFVGTTAKRLANDIGFLFQRLVRMAITFFNGQTLRNRNFVEKTIFILAAPRKWNNWYSNYRKTRGTFSRNCSSNLSMLKYFYDCCPETLSSGTETLPTKSTKGAYGKEIRGQAKIWKFSGGWW